MTKKRIAAFAGLAILPVILALWLAGFDVSYQLGNYVVTDNAVVAGDLYQASAPAAGQIADLLLDVGDSVEKGQGVANLMTGAPAQAPLAAPPRLTTFVRSPGAGTVTHLNVVRGQTVTVGQPVATVADLTSLWLVAQVDEASFKDVRPGQPVEVYLNALDRYFNGEVVGLVPDLPLTPQQTQARASSPSAAKPIAQVPVRVAFDYGDALIYPGMTATIKIFIR
ncbi:MAG TPA: efflux RND transporter periplasmic adaptor subunit [Chloroflexota bacterium]|jgi:multidrug resistance efflux pump